MHEGWCEVPDQLATRTFTIGNTTTREYPDYTPANAPAGFVPAPLAPEVVATGKVLPGVTSPALDPEHTGGVAPAEGKTFGVIGAWDGHRVGKGRVVVDSTWHHFFDINLSGDRYLEDNSLPANQQQKLHGFYVPDGSGGRVPNEPYRMIMWYFRNIVYWLIPADRLQSIWWQALSEIVKRPQLNEELGTMRAPAPSRYSVSSITFTSDNWPSVISNRRVWSLRVVHRPRIHLQAEDSMVGVDPGNRGCLGSRPKDARQGGDATRAMAGRNRGCATARDYVLVGAGRRGESPQQRCNPFLRKVPSHRVRRRQ